MIDTAIQVERIICDYWASAPSNSLHLETGEKAWAMPHVAIAQGDDPLFLRNKEMIGPFHWTPEEAYALAFPHNPMPASELRVISYVLPQTQETRADQRMEKTVPAERWARSRFHGEEFNCDLRLHLAETLTRAGYPSVAPERLSDFGYQQSERFGLASNWSERHAAFVAGLGTFGLSDAMITRWGKAVRFGSVVSRINLPVTKRVYGEDHHAWCLWYAKGTCGACAKRYPVDAITTTEGHDKQAVSPISGEQRLLLPLEPTALGQHPAAYARSKSLARLRCHRRCSKNSKPNEKCCCACRRVLRRGRR